MSDQGEFPQAQPRKSNMHHGPPNRPHQQHYRPPRSYHYNHQGPNLSGIKDLRELLDRKHKQERDKQGGRGPPPEPSYNFLRDPLREPNEDKCSSNLNKSPNFNRKGQNQQVLDENRNKNFCSNFEPKGRGRGTPLDIRNPFNIKIELTSPGSRTCTVDETKTLPDIKHVPDQIPYKRGQYHNARGRGGRRGGHSHRKNEKNDSNVKSEGESDKNGNSQVELSENELVEPQNCEDELNDKLASVHIGTEVVVLESKSAEQHLEENREILEES